jgi:hypothetical protein
MGQAERLLEVAKGEIGYLEKKSNARLDDKTANAGSGNFTKFWDALKPSFQGQPWCAAYCVWCARQVGVSADVLPSIYSCSQFIDWFRARGQWLVRSMVAKPGDLVFFSDSRGAPAHVGLVYRVDSKIYTYEGNTSSAAGVVANGGCVAAKSYDAMYSRILGYGRPKYAAESNDNDKGDDIVTQADFDKMMSVWLAARDKLGKADNRAPLEFDSAVAAGITDGTRPQAFATRQEVAVMCKRVSGGA